MRPLTLLSCLQINRTDVEGRAAAAHDSNLLRKIDTERMYSDESPAVPGLRKQTPEAWRAKRGLCEWPYTTMSPVGAPITNLWLERRKNAVVVVLLVLLVRDQVAMVNQRQT